MKRVALYVRVSTEEQEKHGISVDAQITALTEYAQENNYIIVDIYNDAGISARKTYKKRPALLRMIKDCQQGKIDLILMCKLDRFFRSVSDYYAVMEQIGDIPWKTIHEEYETETANGMFKVNIMLSVNQSEADRSAERIKKVFEYKRNKGEICSGSVAYGYRIENKKWVKNEKISNAIDKFYEHYLATFKFKESYEYAKNYGLTCSYKVALLFLSNTRYYASEKYVTEPYITKEQFDLIQKKRKTYPKDIKHDYIFRSLAKCGLCGCSMSGKTSAYINKDGIKKTIKSYICSSHVHGYDCIGSTISEKDLEQYLMDEIDALLGSYNLKVKAEQQSLNYGHISALKGKLTRLKNLYELGDIEFDEYKTKRDSIIKELKKLESVPMKVQKQMPDNWKNIYQELDISHKNAFWFQTIEHIEITGRRCKKPIVYF